MKQDLLKDYFGISLEHLLEIPKISLWGEKMKRKNIITLLETYENRDFSYDRAKSLEESPLNINDELIA